MCILWSTCIVFQIVTNYCKGIAAEIRAEVWKFLVRYWKWDSTASERAKLQSEKELVGLTIKLTNSRLEYHTIKKQWETMTPEQESNWKKFRNRKLIIDKDVWRTDRYHPAFHDDDSPNLIKLRNILLTYTLYNYDMGESFSSFVSCLNFWDLTNRPGYCQGMNDILVPILLVQEDEADAFWCFTCALELSSLRLTFLRRHAGLRLGVQEKSNRNERAIGMNHLCFVFYRP